MKLSWRKNGIDARYLWSHLELQLLQSRYVLSVPGQASVLSVASGIYGVLDCAPYRTGEQAVCKQYSLPW